MAKSKGNRIGVWIIVGLLFVGLVGFGGAGLVTGARSIGTVGDKEITPQAYAFALRTEINAFSSNIGVPVSFAQVEPLGLPDAILAQTVSERVLDNETAALGLSAGDAVIAERIFTDPRFSGLSGQFDRDAYRAALRNDGINERDYETGLREDLARALLQASVVRGIAPPDAYTDALIAYLGERRTFTFAEITADNLDEPVAEPDQAEIAAYFEANAEAYRSPEVRQLTFAWLTPEMLSGEIEIDEDTVRGVYDERIADYVQEERRLVEQLVFRDTETAAAALARIAAGELDFDGLVAERGLDLADVDLGDRSAADLGVAGDGVFAASPGDVVGPFDTELGAALYRVNAVLAASEVPFEDAREELEAELATARARRVIADSREQIADLLVGGATLEDVVDRTDLVLETMAWSADVRDGAAAYDLFREAAAIAEVGGFPELVELDDGGLFVLRLDAIEAPALQSLDAVRPLVVADMIAEQTAARIAELAADYTGSLGEGAGFDTLGLAAETQVGLLRRDFVAGTPAGFMTLVFDMGVGEVATAPTERGTIVVRLDEVAAADPEDATLEIERAETIAAARDGMAQDIYTAYTRVLQDQIDISIDEAAVEGVHSMMR